MKVLGGIEKATTKLEPGETCLQAQPVLPVLLAQLAQSGVPSCSGGCRTLRVAFAEVTDHLICKQGPEHLPAFPPVMFTEPELPSCKLLCPRKA